VKLPRPITRYGSPILRKVVAKVTEVTPDLVALTDEMLDVMRQARGVGLAGNQIGLDLSVAVVQYEGVILRMFNPKLLKKSGEQRYEEGCLSIPGIHGDVSRALEVTVQYLGVDGKVVEESHTGHVARIIQHEVDHLNGIMIVNHFSVASRTLHKKVLERMQKETLAEGKGRG
jgi:peptide deformylase